MACSVDTSACQICGSLATENVLLVQCHKCHIEACEACSERHTLENSGHLFQSIAGDNSTKSEMKSDTFKMCDYHPHMRLKYICHTHHTLCCTECKYRHKTCNNIQTIDKAAKGIKTSQSLRSFLNDLKRSEEAYEKLERNCTKNIQRLEDVSHTLETKLNKCIGNILVSLGIYSSVNCIRQNVHQIQTVEKQKTINEQHQLILNKDLIHCNRKRLQTLLQRKCSENEMFIEMAKFRKFYNRQKEELGMLSRSAVEKDVKIDVSHNIKGGNIVSMIHNIQIQSKPVIRTPFALINKQESCTNAYSEETSERDASLVTYELNGSIKIHKLKRRSFIKCIQVLKNKKIVLLDNNNPRILVYKISGQLDTKLELPGMPHASTVVNDRLLITIPSCKKVCSIDTCDFEMKPEEHMCLGSECYGILAIKDKILLNSSSSGLFIINSKGKVLQKFPTLTGKQMFCAGKHNDIFTTKQFSQTIMKFNIINEVRKHYPLPIRQPCGIATDRTANNLFVACNFEHKIIKLECKSMNITVILDSENDSILHPWAVYYDTNSSQLLISHMKSERIEVYKEKSRINI